MSVIPKTQDFDKLAGELADAQYSATEYIRIVSEAQAVVNDNTPLMREALKKRDEARWRSQMAHHVRSGKCAVLKHVGSTWYGHAEPCPNNAKAPTRFCGVHRREAEYEEKET